MSLLSEIEDSDIEDDVKEAFGMFDTDGYGFITAPCEHVVYIFSYYLFIKSSFPKNTFPFPDLSHVMQSMGDKLSEEETQGRKIVFLIPIIRNLFSRLT